ncbi:MAG: hypothetical protein Q4D62_02715 [Planctomycetia bacterium]|nr:hypothetical protein [Planctomycetia bacterium]
MRTDRYKTQRFEIRRFAAWGKAETEILKRRCRGKKEEDYVFSPAEAMVEKWAIDAVGRKTQVSPTDGRLPPCKQATYPLTPQGFTTTKLNKSPSTSPANVPPGGSSF